MNSDSQVLIFATERGAADHAARTLREACRARPDGRIAVALSGGSTPKLMYERLVEDYREEVPWERLEIFFSDERTVLPADPHSNYRLAADHLLSRVPVGEERVHRMRAEEENLQAAARLYEESIRGAVPAGPEGVPAFDLVWLGLGVDGHTASLFPGTTALDERERLVVACDVPALGTWRMTFTLPLLCAARRVQFLVMGAGKAAAVRRVLEPPAREAGPASHEIPPPAALVRLEHGQVEWLLDRAAAGEILDPGLLAHPGSDTAPEIRSVDPWKSS